MEQAMLLTKRPRPTATTNPLLGLETSTHSSTMGEKLDSTLEMTRPTSYASMMSRIQFPTTLFTLEFLEDAGEVFFRILHD